jgi:hypothetical protein
MKEMSTRQQQSHAFLFQPLVETITNSPSIHYLINMNFGSLNKLANNESWMTILISNVINDGCMIKN